MHKKRKWCHQSNHFASKGKDSTNNQLAKGHENILKGNWAPLFEVLWYMPSTCSVLLRNSFYRQRHITGPLFRPKSCSYCSVQHHLRAGAVHVLLLEGYLHNVFRLLMTRFFVLSPMMFFTTEWEKCMASSDPSLNDFIPAVIFLVEYEQRSENGTICFWWDNLILRFNIFLLYSGWNICLHMFHLIF